MTKAERIAAIKAHGAVHEKKIARRKAARYAKDMRNKKRGLQAFINRLDIR
jgi:hypothetical protein